MAKKFKKINDNTFKLAIGSEEIEVGNKDAAEFKPSAKLKKWGEECFLNIGLPTTENVSAVIEYDKLKWKGKKKEVVFYAKDKKVYESLSDTGIVYPSLDDSHTVEIVGSDPQKLLIDGEEWMSDAKSEVDFHKQIADAATGDVLVAGLGLGIVQEFLLQNPAVTSVITVEAVQEVIDKLQEIKPQIFVGKHTIVHDDCFSYCQTTSKKFDYIYGDIWIQSGPRYFYEWEKFEAATSPLLKAGGVIDSFLKRDYERAICETTDAFEMELILKEKPSDNKFLFDIETQGLKFYYQKFLTQEEKDAGSFRLPDVEGSYAVYHSFKKNNKYKAGKAFHIYRPKAFDADGKETWCVLHIDEAAGKLEITVPQEFLDSGKYPIIIDPTFGETEKGGTVWSITNASAVTGSSFTMPASGTGNWIKAYILEQGIGSTSHLSKAAIYDHSDSTTITNGVTDEETIPAAQDADFQWTFGTDPDLTKDDVYILVCWAATAARTNVNMYYDDGVGTEQGHEYDKAYDGTFTSPATFSHLDATFTIYCDYTVGGATETKTFIADAILVDRLTKTFTADAFLLAHGLTKEFTADAYLRKIGTKEFTADAYLRAVQTKVFTVDAYLRKTGSKEFVADAVLVDRLTKQFSADAFLQKEQSKEFEADGILVNRHTKELTADAYLRKPFTKTFSADAFLRAVQTKEFTADAYLQSQGLTKAFTADAYLRKSYTKQFTVDSYLQSKGLTKAFTADAILHVATVKQFTADAILKATFTKEFTADAFLRKVQTKEFTGDAIVVNRETKTFSADAFLLATQTKAFTGNAVVVDRLTKTFTADALLRIIYFKSFTADAFLRAVFTKTFSADAFLQKKGLTKTFSADAVLRLVATKEFTANAILKVRKTKVFTADAWIRLRTTKTFTANAILRVVTIKTFTVDAVLTGTGTKTMTADAILHRSFIRHQLDVHLRDPRLTVELRDPTLDVKLRKPSLDVETRKRDLDVKLRKLSLDVEIA